MNHTPKAYIHQNWTLNHTSKPNPNCHIQSIKTNIATKALHNIQSEIRKWKIRASKGLDLDWDWWRCVRKQIFIGAADLACRNIPYSDQRFPHTKIFVEKMRERERERRQSNEKQIKKNKSLNTLRLKKFEQRRRA